MVCLHTVEEFFFEKGRAFQEPSYQNLTWKIDVTLWVLFHFGSRNIRSFGFVLSSCHIYKIWFMMTETRAYNSDERNIFTFLHRPRPP